MKGYNFLTASQFGRQWIQHIRSTSGLDIFISIIHPTQERIPATSVRMLLNNDIESLRSSVAYYYDDI